VRDSTEAKTGNSYRDKRFDDGTHIHERLLVLISSSFMYKKSSDQLELHYFFVIN